MLTFENNLATLWCLIDVPVAYQHLEIVDQKMVQFDVKGVRSYEALILYFDFCLNYFPRPKA